MTPAQLELAMDEMDPDGSGVLLIMNCSIVNHLFDNH